MNHLFCTPEQGQRLKELVPELKSSFVWQRLPNWSEWVINFASLPDKHHEVIPALTLQELRDLAYQCEDIIQFDISEHLRYGDAKSFAAWVIERLEGN